MFEDALVESSGRIRTHCGSFSGVAAICNGAMVCVLMLWPLLHPASLPRQVLSLISAAPAPPAMPVPHIQPPAVAVRATTVANPFAAPIRIPSDIRKDHDATRAVGNDFVNPLAQQGAGLPGGLADSIGNATMPQVHMASPKRLAISSGVMAGNKVSGVTPQYPAIARAARIEGTVVLGATISKNGTIENLHVISGSPMLTSAAEQAVRTWRYRPYLLNGEPVEVETTVNVNFHLGS
jgi:periplasmic protein TonB